MKLKENKDERVELKAEDYICNNDNEDDDEDFVPRNDYVDFVIRRWMNLRFCSSKKISSIAERMTLLPTLE